MMSHRLRLLPLLVAVALAGCATPRKPVVPPPPPAAIVAQPAATPPRPSALQTALDAGIRAAPPLASLPGWAESDPRLALAAFQKSCKALLKRADASGLTRPGDWAEACAAAANATDAKGFFTDQFVPVQVGAGTGLNTGYFEPDIAGGLTPDDINNVPIYRKPPDLIDVDLSPYSMALKGKKFRGRMEGIAPAAYWDRGQIEDGALAGRGLEIAYAADPYELFFLHIQGSGRVVTPDGRVLRIGYDGQNGREYVGIGSRLRGLGVLGPGQATMEGIIAWLRANPDQGKALMRENKSYVFFKLLTGDGPLGALGVALTPEYSVAADPKFVPLGAPLWLDTMIPEPNDPSAPAAPGYTQTPFRRMMVAQDTGGAIKGANRFDLFWGAGQRARAVAGGLSWKGTTTLLLPRVAVARLLGGSGMASGGSPPRP